MKWVEGNIVSKKLWAPGLYSLFIKGPSIPFVAGQFTQIKLVQENLFRPYSFLNAPDDPILEFYFTLVKAGSFSSKLAALSLNSTILIAQKACGRFILAEVPDAQILWCFATGTGIGVFLSLLKTQALWKRFNKVVLVHSVRYGMELTHQVLIETWQAQYAGRFKWCPIVTRESKPHAFNKRIPLLLQSNELEDAIKLSLTALNSQVMLCGNPSMITQVTRLLVERGLKLNHLKEKGQITVENYWKDH